MKKPRQDRVARTMFPFSNPEVPEEIVDENLPEDEEWDDDEDFDFDEDEDDEWDEEATE